MVIRKQPIISFLLGKSPKEYINKYGVPALDNQMHYMYLMQGVALLEDINESRPDWGIPELIMPSFEKAMKKSVGSFVKMDHQLFQEFNEDKECGILLIKGWSAKGYGTVIYRFADNRLYVWLFENHSDISILRFYYYIESTEQNTRKQYVCPFLTSNPQIFHTSNQSMHFNRDEIYNTLTNYIIIYLAVKKYADVECVVVPPHKIVSLAEIQKDDSFKEKVKNDSGQEVILMDSRWFTTYVNNNIIHVRGYFKKQHHKNENGEWTRKLIFVKDHSRNGYTRKALLSDSIE